MSGSRDLEADQNLCDRATPGPWWPRATSDDYYMNARYVSTEPGPGGMNWKHDHLCGMAFSKGEPTKVIAITLLQHPMLAVVADSKYDENMEFIAAARDALPYWLNEVKRLREFWEAYNALNVAEGIAAVAAAEKRFDKARTALQGGEE